MNAGFFLNHLIGFALQVLPPIALMLLPFPQSAFRLRRRTTWTLFSLMGVGMSAAFAFLMYANQRTFFGQSTPAALQGYWFANALMCLSIALSVSTFIVLLRAPWSHRLFSLFSAICFASIQYSLTNILLALLPAKTASGQVYDTHTVLVFALVTALLLPPFAVFFHTQLRRYLQQNGAQYSTRDLAFLATLTALYLAINAIIASSWGTLRDATGINGIYYPLTFLLLTGMLVMVYYTTIRLSILREADAQSKMQSAIIRENHRRIQRNMEVQQKLLHDCRHLLISAAALAREGDLEKFQAYVEESLQRMSLPDDRICADRLLNGILQYYVTVAAASGTPFSMNVETADLSGFRETDVTVLLGNALENAIRAARDYRAAHPDSPDGIQITAETARGLFSVQLENPCEHVAYAKPSPLPHASGYLPAEAFLSTTGGGQGLKRIASVCACYDGMASYRFDEHAHRFYTRITLVVPETKTL